MTALKKINVYVANHRHRLGIEDYVSIIEDVFGKRGYEISVTSDLVENSINFVIDEFTNVLENDRIRQFKATNPDNILVLFLTEFIEKKYLVKSANHFGGLFDSAILSFFDLYLRRTRRDLAKPDASCWAKVALFSPFLMVKLTAYSLWHISRRLRGRHEVSPIERLIARNSRLFYFHMRYMGLRSILPCFDALITSHKSIADSLEPDEVAKHLGILQPEIDAEAIIPTMMVNKKPFIEVTGSVTAFRRYWMRKIDAAIDTLGLSGALGPCQAIPFSQGAPNQERGAFSIHPPQSHGWKYSSPTRLYRAIVTDRNLPILTKHFGQSPIEDVCFLLEGKKSYMELYELYFNREKFRTFFGTRLEAYAKIVDKENDKLCENLAKIR